MKGVGGGGGEKKRQQKYGASNTAEMKFTNKNEIKRTQTQRPYIMGIFFLALKFNIYLKYFQPP
jgi:hypothetical protein